MLARLGTGSMLGRLGTAARLSAAPLARRMSATAAPASSSGFMKRLATPSGFAAVGIGFYGWLLLDWKFGEAEDFFDGRFITEKDPEALVDFYSAEELLKIIAILPIFFDFVMGGVEWDTEAPEEKTMLLSLDESHMNVKYVGMEVSFEIIEEEDEDEDIVVSFSRHERFKNYVPLLADMGIKIRLWDQTWNYGYKVRGVPECYSRCEHAPRPCCRVFTAATCHL